MNKAKRKLSNSDDDFLSSSIFPSSTPSKPKLQFTKNNNKDKINNKSNNNAASDDDFLNTPALQLETKTSIKIGGEGKQSKQAKLKENKNAPLKRRSSDGDEFLYKDVFSSNNNKTIKSDKNTTPTSSTNKPITSTKGKIEDEELTEEEQRSVLKFRLDKELKLVMAHLTGVVQGKLIINH